jgi:molybdenum cofactor cytidylyltransferase
LIAAIVLAAGTSSRMGRPKQVLPVKGKPMLEMVLDVYRRAKVDAIVVVLGANAAQIMRGLNLRKERVITNPLYRNGMSGSLRLGLREAEKGADAVIVALADQPFLSTDTINKMIEAYSKTRAPVVVPVYRGVRGNPVLFDRSLFSEIKRIRGDRGARSVVERHRDRLLEVAVEDEGVLFDIDTPSDYLNANSSRRT